MASVSKRGGRKAKGPWYASWQDHNGRRQTKCTGTTDKATAERIARKHEADAALRREGVIDPVSEALLKESRRDIQSHMSEYETKLRSKGCTDDHVNRTLRFVRTIAEAAEFQKAADITEDGVNTRTWYSR